MVVDDEPIIGKLLTMFLTEENYEVTSFTRGKKALEHLKTNGAVSLLLTDVNMPEMSGIELARQVKTLYPTLPIIVMSGSADGQTRDEIFSLGADFIPKPFGFTELIEKINYIMPEKSGDTMNSGERRGGGTPLAGKEVM